MTLKEKITEKSLIFPLCLEPSNQEIINYNLAIDKLEQVAEEFAIGFAEWCDDNYFRMGRLSFWAESMDWDNDNKFTTKELLEIYKKEKGL